MTTQTGPAELRRLADELTAQFWPYDPDKTHGRGTAIDTAVKMRDQAAAWGADRRELSNVNADREKIWKALQESEAELERARALLSKLRDGLDDYWAYCNSEVLAELAAALGSGGAA